MSWRQVMAWSLNVLLPGAGLIIRRRAWLGFSLAFVFGICGNVALAGWLIAPAAVPTWLTQVALGLAGLAWLSAQLLLRRQDHVLRRRASGLAAILREAGSALEAGDLGSARLALESGVAINDESADLYALQARLCALEDDPQGMRAAWRRVVKLDRDGRYREEAKRVLRQAR